MSSNHRQAHVEISLSALLHNYQQVKNYAPHSKIMAVIKADAYGHGVLAVAKCLSKEGVDAFAVACVDEAILLRKNNFTEQLIILEGFSSKQELLAIIDYNLIPIINNFLQLELIENLINNENTVDTHPLPIWIKLDTGMHRLGFQSHQINQLKIVLKQFKSNLKVKGLMSHFACADNSQSPALKEQQLKQFQEEIEQFNFSNVDYSIANSAAVIDFSSSHYQWVRPGIMLYGANPILARKDIAINLLPVMTVKSKLIAINYYEKGECIGYGRSWCCPERMPVGVVAIGYGDGYPRHAPSGTPVLLNGVKTQLLGRVSMDMISIDLRPLIKINKQDLSANIGDSVTLWGDGLAVEEVADFCSTISYALLCGLNQRILENRAIK